MNTEAIIRIFMMPDDNKPIIYCYPLSLAVVV